MRQVIKMTNVISREIILHNLPKKQRLFKTSYKQTRHYKRDIEIITCVTMPSSSSSSSFWI